MAYNVGWLYRKLYGHYTIGFDRGEDNRIPPSVHRLLLDGQPCMPEEIPIRAKVPMEQKPLHDFVLANSTYLTACESFRQIVETLEPDVHQFFPLELVHQDGTPYPVAEPYYVVNVLHTFDAVLVARSNVQWVDGGARGPHFLQRGPGTFQLTLSPSAIAGRHLWRGDKLFPNDLYFSEQLGQAVQAKKLKGLFLTHLEEVDERWVAEENLAPVQGSREAQHG